MATQHVRALARRGGTRRAQRAAQPHVHLYDANGRAFDATAEVHLSAWKGSRESRRTRAWTVTDLAINAMLGGDVAALRRRSRDLVRNNAWAQSAIDAYVANSVGEGIVPRPMVDDPDLRRELAEAWDEFVEFSDPQGQLDFYGQQALVARSSKEGGDVFGRVLQVDSFTAGIPVPLQIELMEAEFVDPAYDVLTASDEQGWIQAGIEFDRNGRRTAYHVWRSHPGEPLQLRNVTRSRVPASEMIHVFNVTRPGQIRGVPDLAPVLAKLYELEKYEDAELLRKQIAAMFAGFVVTPNPDDNPLDVPDGAGSLTDPDDLVDDDGTPLPRLEPGTMQELGPGQDIRFSTPAETGSSYEPFTRSQLRQAAGALGVTYEQLAQDLERVNFSSIRAGLIEFYKRLEQRRRNTIIFQFCRPVWRRFLETVFLTGRVQIPRDPRILRQTLRVKWTPTPGREYVDPEKEVRAILLKLRAGLTSRSRAVAEEGYDPEELDREIAADNERADSMGLRFDGDGRTPPAGAPVSGEAPPQDRSRGDDGGNDGEGDA